MHAYEEEWEELTQKAMSISQTNKSEILHFIVQLSNDEQRQDADENGLIASKEILIAVATSNSTSISTSIAVTGLTTINKTIFDLEERLKDVKNT